MVSLLEEGKGKREKTLNGMVSPSSPERLATESTSGDGYSPGKPLDLTLNVIDSQKMVGTDDARVLEKVNGVQTVELNCEPVAMEASIIHTVDSCGNMSSDVLLVDSKSGLDNGSGSKNDDGLTMVTMNKEETTLKLSFRDMVVGKNQNESLVSEILELDVLIGDGDVRFGMEDGTPTIDFSDWLHQLIDKKLEHSIVVRLLGRTIGFSYQYYTNSLFRLIAGIIGKIVRIEYNTEEGKHGRFARLAVVVDLSKPFISSIIIDRTRQRIEYDGLPTICYQCVKYGHLEDKCSMEVDNSCATKTMEIVDIIVSEPENHYGPWMQVMPLQNKRNMARKDSGRTSIGNLSPTTNGNSFDAFIVEDKDLGIQDNGVEGIHVEPIVSKVTKNPKAQRVMATQMNGKTGASSSGTRRRSMESNVV
ncbi:hypothetical protein V6N11_046802 [Hibiscus sabdariffa]|uniref:CCHC-type domain-containing protein n=1 Tax=Hibiscus sabdariffa TaxID=183260 RepID=A0ABR1ZEE5_9ROSI